MERERSLSNITELSRELKRHGVSLPDLRNTARVMTNVAGASIEDLRRTKEELMRLRRSLARGEAERNAKVSALRDWVGISVVACAFGAAMAQRTFDVLKKEPPAAHLAAAAEVEDIQETEADEITAEASAEISTEIAASAIDSPAALQPESISQTSVPPPSAILATAPKIPSSAAAAAREPIDASFYQTPRHLLGISRITEPPAHQNVGLIDRARSPEINEHGYVAVLLAGRRGIGQPEGGPLLDSIKEIIIDPVTGRSVIVSIPRDLAVTYRNRRGRTFRNKINTVHQNAGMGVLKNIVAEITGQPVTHEIVVDLAEMEALSGQLLEILGGRILVEDPQGRHFWSDGDKYYPPQFELTTPEEIHDYVRFRHGYCVKPSYGERVAGLGITNGSYPRPRRDEIVRAIGSSDGRDSRQSIFLQALASNLRGIGIFSMPALASFIEEHFGIPKTTQAAFALLAKRAQVPTAVSGPSWHCPIIRSDGQTAGSTVAIDPNRIRREIKRHLAPADSVAAVGS